MADEGAPPQEKRSGKPSARSISYGAALGSGVLGGGTILLVEFVTEWFGASPPLGPVHVIPRVLNFEPETGIQGHPLASLFVHFTIAFFAALLLGWLIHHRNLRSSLGIGGLGGALFYGGTFLTLILSFPGLSVGSYVAMGLLYVAYGMLFAWLYKLMQPGR